jgi:hypothetical protein
MLAPPAGGVLEVVAGITGQCGSKSDVKRPGKREKMITTQSSDDDEKVLTVK